jgi:hypothetical protein
LSAYVPDASRQESSVKVCYPDIFHALYNSIRLANNDRLYLDHTNYFKDRGLDRSGIDLMQDYFREVLLSYRLLFGQDHKSWKAFQAKIAEWGENWNCSDPNSEDKDDMLLILCGKSYKSQEAREVYEQIDADEDPKEDLSVYYYPDSDFPFFGKRLLNLQAFVKGRHPHNWSALWNDRRNVAYWWTFWVNHGVLKGGLEDANIVRRLFLLSEVVRSFFRCCSWCSLYGEVLLASNKSGLAISKMPFRVFIRHIYGIIDWDLG